MRLFTILLALALALGACGHGSAPTPAPASWPQALSLAPASWSGYTNGGTVGGLGQIACGQGQLCIAFPVENGRASDDYLTTRTPALSEARTLVVSYSVFLSPGAKLVSVDPAAGASACPTPPTVRFIVETTGPWTDSGGNTLEFSRWWSNPVSAPLLASGTFSISVPLKPENFSDVFGNQGTTANAAAFDSVLATPAVGVTFGAGCYFGHGLAVSGGTAIFQINSFEID